MSSWFSPKNLHSSSYILGCQRTAKGNFNLKVCVSPFRSSLLQVQNLSQPFCIHFNYRGCWRKRKKERGCAPSGAGESNIKEKIPGIPTLALLGSSLTEDLTAASQRREHLCPQTTYPRTFCFICHWFGPKRQPEALWQGGRGACTLSKSAATHEKGPLSKTGTKCSGKSKPLYLPCFVRGWAFCG